MRFFLTLFGIAFLLYFIVAAVTYLFQRKLQYIPSLEHITPVEAGLVNVEEVNLTTPDGENLVAWFARAKSEKPTILYFHGNGAGLIDRAERMSKYQALGYGFFIHAYRGYAGSSGSPDEQALVKDAQLAYDHLLNQGIKPKDIVLFGESLGTALAIQLAAKVSVGAIILESPFTSAVNVAALRYPYLPVHALMKDQYLSNQYITKLSAPVLVAHGGLDSVVPLAMGKRMYDLANEPKEFVLLPAAGHNDHDSYGLIANVQAFLKQYILNR